MLAEMPVEPAEKRRQEPRFVTRFGRLDRNLDRLREGDYLLLDKNSQSWQYPFTLGFEG
jgi:hypothetical protein